MAGGAVGVTRAGGRGTARLARAGGAGVRSAGAPLSLYRGTSLIRNICPHRTLGIGLLYGPTGSVFLVSARGGQACAPQVI